MSSTEDYRCYPENYDKNFDNSVLSYSSSRPPYKGPKSNSPTESKPNFEIEAKPPEKSKCCLLI